MFCYGNCSEYKVRNRYGVRNEVRNEVKKGDRNRNGKEEERSR